MAGHFRKCGAPPATRAELAAKLLAAMDRGVVISYYSQAGHILWPDADRMTNQGRALAAGPVIAHMVKAGQVRWSWNGDTRRLVRSGDR